MDSKNIPKVVFISYSHDSGPHREWVTGLVRRIENNTVKELAKIKVIYDQDNGSLGDNLYARMQVSILKADVILLILTPEYKAKAENGIAGVGYEYNLIRHELYKKEGSAKKCIPILKMGTLRESLPADLFHLIGIDMSSPKKFEDGFLNLLQSITDPDLLKNPVPGTGRNDFLNSGSGQTAKAGNTVLFSMVSAALAGAVITLNHYHDNVDGPHDSAGYDHDIGRETAPTGVPADDPYYHQANPGQIDDVNFDDAFDQDTTHSGHMDDPAGNDLSIDDGS